MISEELIKKMNMEMLQNVENAKQNGKKVGLVQGSWDLFHLGHLKYILEARKRCDYLIVAMDSDEKIKKRKGNDRPIIPEEERYEFIQLLNIADSVIVKEANEPKWNLIKSVKPDVLIAIKENYSEEQITELKEFCKEVAILPRQSESSTSDKIRKIMISTKGKQLKGTYEQVLAMIEEMKARVGFTDDLEEPLPMLFENLKDSTDVVCPVSTACFWNGKWYFGANHSDFNIPKYDIINRTELYYATTEHAEMNLLKKLGDVPVLNTPIWTTLFPCDKCMKVLIDKGVKEIFYLEDHPERNWSKRSHELALKNGIKVTQIHLKEEVLEDNQSVNYPDMDSFQYIYPPNARHQEQLDIMMNLEGQNKDPLDPEIIEQEILYMTDYWYISPNRFPYAGVEQQFLIIARNPIYKKEDITKEMWLDLQNIVLDLSAKYNIPGGALCFRFGDPALSGASLKRLHAHLIQPKEENQTKFTIGGHKMLKKGLVLKYFQK